MGDCYFIGTLGALDARPGALEKLFVTQKVNDKGIYAVRFYIEGKWRVVVVDDYVPMKKWVKKFEGGKEIEGWLPAMAQSRILGEIWPSIIEKAWVKLMGTYEAAVGGDPQFVMNYLSDDPGVVVRIRKPCHGCPHIGV